LKITTIILSLSTATSLRLELILASIPLNLLKGTSEETVKFNMRRNTSLIQKKDQVALEVAIVEAAVAQLLEKEAKILIQTVVLTLKT
jgi:hypothetical protein